MSEEIESLVPAEEIPTSLMWPLAQSALAHLKYKIETATPGRYHNPLFNGVFHAYQQLGIHTQLSQVEAMPKLEERVLVTLP